VTAHGAWEHVNKTNGDNTTADGRRRSSSGQSYVFAPHDLVAGRYKIVRVLGAGGSAEVYEAMDIALGGSVALKTLRPVLANHAVQLERFRREIQNARKITHLNVCRIFDMGLHGEGRAQRFFLTMEFLRGETLAERLANGAAYPTGDALAVALQLCAGLQAAHEAGVIHRDLKPSNVMFANPNPTGSEERLAITDFGLALSEEQQDLRLTESGELLGTPEYMAPEQAEPGEMTPATDVYALGLILYEMLTKRQPFATAGTPLATVLRRRHDPPDPLRQYLPDADPVWESVISRCLAREPQDRYQSAGEVAAALEGQNPPDSGQAAARGQGGLGRLVDRLRRRR
jgi:serine/threonine protein kinase